MPVTIDDALLKAAHLDEQELKREIAVALFAQDRITLAQASRFAEIPFLDFQALLADREICVHYGVEEFLEDIETLTRLGQL
jgi:predicted HTH domain antitoxin